MRWRVVVSKWLELDVQAGTEDEARALAIGTVNGDASRATRSRVQFIEKQATVEDVRRLG